MTWRPARRPCCWAGPARWSWPLGPAPITSASTARSSAGWPGRRPSSSSTSKPSNAGRARPTRRGRQFVKRLFRADPADPRLYHLVIDPTVLGVDATVRVLQSAAEAFFAANRTRQPTPVHECQARSAGAAAMARSGRPWLDGAALLPRLQRWRAVGRLSAAVDLPDDRSAGGDRRRRRTLGRASSGSPIEPTSWGSCCTPFPSSARCTTTACWPGTHRANSWPGWAGRCGRAFPAWT